MIPRGGAHVQEVVSSLTDRRKRTIAAICLLVIPLSGLCIDIYVPSLPSVSKAFHTTKAGAQFTITAYALGYAFGQLFAGVVSDAFGRKRPMLFGTLVHIGALVGILSTPSIGIFIALRAVQGVCVAFTNVPARAIGNDIFKGERFAKFIHWLAIGWAVGPIVAPFIGGYLQDYFGWHANFEFLLIYVGIAFLGVVVFLKETLPQERRTPIAVRVVAKNFRFLLTHKQFVATFLFVGIVYLPAISFSLVAPFIIENVLGHSAIVSGRMALVIGVGWFAGNFASRFLGKISYQKKTVWALWWCLAVALAMAAMGALGMLSLTALVVPTVLIVAPISLLFPVYMTQCFAAFPRIAGLANAVAASGVYLVITLGTFVESQMHARSLLPLGATYVVLIVLGLVLYYALLRTPWHGEDSEKQAHPAPP